MKRIFLLLLMVVGITLSGCSNTETSKPKVESYIIPTSYYRLTGSTVSEAVEDCLANGSDYCVDAKEVEEGLQLDLTEEQKNSIIERNNAFVEELINEFLSASSLYRWDSDDSYQKLTMYFDEKISPALSTKTMLGVVSMYGMNYMLINKTTDWSVLIEIINCHTNKEVYSINIPKEEGSYGAKEWEASYNE